METKKRSSIVVGIILILLGVFLIGGQVLKLLTFDFQTWPFYIIGSGLFLLVLGAITSTPDLAVPACIVGGIGGILFWQANTSMPNPWASWTYAWALIPGFVAVGMLLARLMGEKKRYSWKEIIDTLLVSLIMFTVFYAIFGSMFQHIPDVLKKYWPLLLVVAGVVIFIRGFIKPRKAPVAAPPEMPATPAAPVIDAEPVAKVASVEAVDEQAKTAEIIAEIAEEKAKKSKARKPAKGE